MKPNLITKLLDKDYAAEYLSAKLGRDVEIKDIKPIKNNVWETTYHIVFRYDVVDCGASKIFYVTAHDNEPRENVFRALSYLNGRGFADGKFQVPQPLFFDKSFNATFYEGLSGQDLYQCIRSNDRPVVTQVVIEAAEWFARLHALPIEGRLAFDQGHDSIRKVAPGAEAVLESINMNYPHLIHQYDRFYRYFIETEDSNAKVIGKSIIHGDAHPENIINMSDGRLGVIDFVDMTVGDPARDLGTFLQQFDYMAGRKIGDRPYIEETKQLFLTTYLGHAKMDVTADLSTRISLYYAWTAIRTATFFLMRHNPEPDRAEPLIAEVDEMLKLKI